MRDYIEIGSSPTDEACAQLGTDPDFHWKNRIECEVFRKQLRRVFGEEPEGANLSIKCFQHDFGRYCEVVCYFDDKIPESEDYAFKLEGDTPERWDSEAIKELKERMIKKCSY
jgi:hypothetical protein